jgi:hypothetical protein
MQYYRMYFLSPNDRINGVEEIESVCDDIAIAAATRKADGLAFELWNQDRLVLRRNSTAIEICD